MDPMESLVQAARRLGGTRDLEELIDWLLLAICRDFKCQACSISLADRVTGDLIMRSSENRLRGGSAIRIPRGHGIAGRVFLSRVPEIAGDASRDPAHYGGVDHASGSKTGAMMTVPLSEGGDCLGVMQALNPVGRSVFSDNELAVFEAFAGLVGITVRRIEEQRRAIERAELDREIKIAGDLVRRLLPDPDGEASWGRYRAYYRPASAVGGDFFMVERVGAELDFMALGDVCGHGIPAALEMVRVSTVIRGRLPELAGHGLGAWVGALNAVLCNMVHRSRFTGASFLVLRPDVVEVLVAGHELPLVWLDDGRIDPGRLARHRPLGLKGGQVFEAFAFPRRRFRGAMMISDGVLESRNRSGGFFSETAMGSVRWEQVPSEREFEEFVRAFEEFNDGGGDREDDATILWVSERDWVPAAFELACDPRNFSAVRAWLEDRLSIAGVDEPRLGLIILGVDELLSNLYRHEFKGRPARLRIGMSLRDGHGEICLAYRACDAAPEGMEGPSFRSGGMGLKILSRVFTDTERTLAGDEMRIVARLISPV